jgi:hypothetical protein
MSSFITRDAAGSARAPRFRPESAVVRCSALSSLEHSGYETTYTIVAGFCRPLRFEDDYQDDPDAHCGDAIVEMASSSEGLTLGRRHHCGASAGVGGTERHLRDRQDP